MRIPTLLSRLALLGAGAGLLACAPLGGRPAIDGAAADDAYLAGRNHHLARRYAEAHAAYAQALAAAPGHVDARNGLATLHAERREFGQAIALWRALTAPLDLASGPGKAYLFSNLGHAYFLAGDYNQALVALEKACLLDPLSQRAWQLLGETLRQLGQEERAGQMLAQAAALRAHDFRADYATAGAPATAAAIARAVDAGPREDGGWEQVQLHARADGLLELRRGGSPAAPQPTPLQDLPDAVLPPLALLEIRNGNGMRGMARSLARQLGGEGLQVRRLSNQKGFAVRRTRIEYEAPYRAAAERLAARLGGVRLQEVARCAPVHLRVVLGRDLARRGFSPRPEPGATLLAAQPPG